MLLPVPYRTNDNLLPSEKTIMTHSALHSSIEVRDKVVLITGSNRGIGKSLVETMMQNGAAKVYAAMRTVDQTIFAEFANKVVPIYLDLTDPASIVTAAAETATDVQIVVNNAGILSDTRPLDEGAVAALQNEMNVNVYGMLHLARAFVPVLEANARSTDTVAAFCQINSTASFRCPMASASTYAASKAASYSLTQALRKETFGRPIRFLSVHPGPIATDMVVQAGLAHLAEPPAQVGDALVAALRDASDVFHVYPDTVSRTLAESYAPFAKQVVEKVQTYND